MSKAYLIAALCQRSIPSKILVPTKIGVGVVSAIQAALVEHGIASNMFDLLAGEGQLDSTPYLDKGDIKYLPSEIVKSIASGTPTIIGVDTGLPSREIKKLSTLVDETRCHVIVVIPEHVDPIYVLDEKALSNVMTIAGHEIVSNS